MTLCLAVISRLLDQPRFLNCRQSLHHVMVSGESAVVLLSRPIGLASWWLTMTNHNFLWDYIKPTLQTGEVRRELREPSPPIVATFSATPNATIQSLDSDKLKDWQRHPSENPSICSFRVCTLSSENPRIPQFPGLQSFSFNHRLRQRDVA